MIKETLKKAGQSIEESIRSCLQPVALSLFFSFLNIGLLYVVVYQAVDIYSNHVNQVTSNFNKQANSIEILIGIFDSVSDKANTNNNSIRNHADIINHHTDVLNDHIEVLTNHTDAQAAVFNILMDHNAVITIQQKRIKRLEAIVSNLQKKLGYDENRPMPENEI